MARLWTSGGEWGDTTAEAAGGSGFAANGVTLSTVNPRTGTYAWRQTTNARAVYSFAGGAFATTYYVRAYVYVSAIPTFATPLIGIGAAGNFYGISINTDGTLLMIDRNTNQVGSASAVVSAGTWLMLEASISVASSGAAVVQQARLDGVSFATGNGGTLSVVPGEVHFAGNTGTIPTVDSDDIAFNDSTGASQNTWPGEGKVVLLKPVSDNAAGTGWTLGTGTASGGNAFAAVDNTPPLGVADLTAGSDPKQIRNAMSNANVNYDANLTTYTNAGLATGATVNVVIPSVATSAPVVTSAKAGTIGIASNPAITNVALGAGGTAGAFWAGLAGGTYPSGWKWSKGTTTYAPAVTLGSSPVARITQVTASTRIAVVCALGMYVDYTPAAAPAVKKTPHKNQVAVMRPVLR